MPALKQNMKKREPRHMDVSFVWVAGVEELRSSMQICEGTRLILCALVIMLGRHAHLKIFYNNIWGPSNVFARKSTTLMASLSLDNDDVILNYLAALSSTIRQLK